ncbi:hypothetical protein [Methylopila sp. M107]|uniref:hypothetical protein n=1 Tax=Methylopila sp. M107 TaxID=1101190 RepID=UPI00037DB7C3|nr:hypothetical protein [Methylopila sp. M107]
MTTRFNPTFRCLVAATVLLGAASAAGAQGGVPGGGQGGGGQGGLSPDTPVLAPTPPGPSTGAQPAAPAPEQPAAGAGPKTPLPPRDGPKTPLPARDGPKTPLPDRDGPRAPQPGQRTAAAPDPDWPCVQVKVPTLSYGQMWAGPALDDALKSWREDKRVAELVGTIAARRTKIADVKQEVAEFAKDAGPEADRKLTLLFAGAFDELNGQRSQIMAGIQRYSRKQRELADAIKEESLRIAKMPQDMASQNSPEALKEQETLNWRTRIYEERTQSLTYVCETPVLIEQRVFELGRLIQTHLSQAQ